MPQAIIFDMDGVIVDSEVHWKKVESEFLSGLVSHWDEELQRSIIGLSAYDVHALLVKEHGASLSRQEFVDFYKGIAREIYGSRSNLIPGAVEAVALVERLGFTLGLASSSPRAWIDIVLRRFPELNRFKAVVSSDDLCGKGKPHPDIYLLAATKVGFFPEQCAAIEDTAKGIASAKSAGLRCIGFRNGFNETQDLSAADLVIQGFNDLDEKLLLGL